MNWLRWPRVPGTDAPTRAAEASIEEACPGIARVLARLFGSDRKPEVLDLGQASGSPALYLADRGARVHVENFEPPASTAEKKKATDDEIPPRPPLRIGQPDAKFDLVLAWEHGDFIPPERLDEFTAELRRVLAPGGWVVLFAQDRQLREDGVRSDRASSYRLASDDRIVREPQRGPARPRWTYPNRRIEKALAPLAVQGIHLHGDRVREVVAQKPAR
jgi:SAM-dependent methyltransferase